MSLCHPLQTEKRALERKNKNLARSGPAVVDWRHTAFYRSSLCCSYFSKFLSYILSYSYYLLKFLFSLSTLDGINIFWVQLQSRDIPSVSFCLMFASQRQSVEKKKVLPVNHHLRTKGHNSPKGKVFYSQILLPQAYHNPLMEKMHGGLVRDHLSIERTLACLKTRYFWYNIKDNVSFCCSCFSCATKTRPKKTPRAAMGTVQVDAPMKRIGVDLMGPLKEKERHVYGKFSLLR